EGPAFFSSGQTDWGASKHRNGAFYSAVIDESFDQISGRLYTGTNAIWLWQDDRVTAENDVGH
ncbi:MAG: hypothetical protein WBW27_12630, partial [Pseudolabrys sp.]